MADNLNISEGSGKVISTHEVSSVHTQRVTLGNADTASWKTVSAYTSITGSYSTALTNSNVLKLLKLINDTDADLYISFDASNNHWVIKAGTTDTIDLCGNGMAVAGNISVKQLTTYSSGTLYVCAGY